MTAAIETSGRLEHFGSTRAVDGIDLRVDRGMVMHGNVEASNVVWVLVASAVITAVFAPIAMRMYHKER